MPPLFSLISKNPSFIVFVLHKDEILEEEPKILEKSKYLMSRIYLDDIDVLIVNEIGKNISGTGVDTNIVGRFHTNAASGGPNTINGTPPHSLTKLTTVFIRLDMKIWLIICLK